MVYAGRGRTLLRIYVVTTVGQRILHKETALLSLSPPLVWGTHAALSRGLSEAVSPRPEGKLIPIATGLRRVGDLVKEI